ncbi:hypothetical protein NIES2104_02190 [Leptolyngbya sp. NIES-2104]|nr:hypothetical protein NIES2104_02190 [Leptolyngbya sp. NIES-2104]
MEFCDAITIFLTAKRPLSSIAKMQKLATQVDRVNRNFLL